jgi:cellulose 1,4-beta-cellobiosidase
MDTYLADIEKQNAAGAKPEIIGAFVVYDLPNRDCAALASNGELTVANGGLTKYKAYIDSIAAIIKKHSSTKVALVIEPDSLGNLVTNSNVAKCQEAHDAYISMSEQMSTDVHEANVTRWCRVRNQDLELRQRRHVPRWRARWLARLAGQHWSGR